MKQWCPKAREFTLYASYVCCGHAFFQKCGFKFYDFYHEEAKKQISRKKIGTNNSTDDVIMVDN